MWSKPVISFPVYAWCLLAAIISGAPGTCTTELRGTPLEQWHWRNPLPQGNALHNVVFVNGNWVAVGELGTILTSSDGTNWIRCESGVIDDLRGCAYGGSHYVVVGDFGTVLTSPDGVSWTQQYPGTFYSLNGVTYANGQFVAVGEQTTILTSPDGVDWTPRSSGDWELFDVIQAGGMYVAVGGQQATASTVGEGVILTSPDARVWTRRVLTSGSPFLTVAYGGGQFAVAGGYQYQTDFIWTSDDALTWQMNDTSVLYGLYGSLSLFYGQGKWVLVEGNSYGSYFGTGTILVSTNLLDWSDLVTNTLPVSGIAFANGRFIASRIDGTFLSSSDGLNWVNPVSQPQLFSFNDLEYVNGSFLGVGGNQLVFSGDGSVWTNSITVTNTGNLLSITYGNGRYVAGSEYRTIWTSTDGLNWTNPAPDLSIYPYASDVAVAYGNGVFVGVAGYEGDVLTSPDGLNWTVQQLNTNANTYVYFRDVKFGNGRFVAVSDYAIATSIDGTNWLFNSTSQPLRGVACGNENFVAVGDNTILTSNDGTNWISQISGQFGVLSAVAFGGGFFVATGPGIYSPGLSVEAPIWISSDGIHWSSRHSKTSRGLLNVAFGNGTFVIGGETGAILQSDPVMYLTLTMQPAPQLLLWGPVNRSYRIEYANSMSPSSQWAELATVMANQIPASFSDPSWTNSTTRFYRAVLLP